MKTNIVEDPLDNLLIDVDKKPHVYIIKQITCGSNCPEHACTNFCPSQVFSWKNNKLEVDYTRCVECGACQYSCINQNIHLEYPRGGFGVVFLY